VQLRCVADRPGLGRRRRFRLGRAASAACRSGGRLRVAWDGVAAGFARLIGPRHLAQALGEGGQVVLGHRQQVPHELDVGVAQPLQPGVGQHLWLAGLAVADQGHLEPQDRLGRPATRPVVVAPQHLAQAEECFRRGLVDDVAPGGPEQRAVGGVVRAGQVAQPEFVRLDLAGGGTPGVAPGAEFGRAPQEAVHVGGKRGHDDTGGWSVGTPVSVGASPRW
jgi:hypothetical protein